MPQPSQVACLLLNASFRVLCSHDLWDLYSTSTFLYILPFKNDHTESVTSLSTIYFRSLHVTENFITWSFLISVIFHTVYVPFSLSCHLFLVTSCFQVLAILESATRNKGVQVYFPPFCFWDCGLYSKMWSFWINWKSNS